MATVNEEEKRKLREYEERPMRELDEYLESEKRKTRVMIHIAIRTSVNIVIIGVLCDITFQITHFFPIFAAEVFLMAENIIGGAIFMRIVERNSSDQ